ncbi:hypothetical protein NicSoilB8_46230 (plasmid) [Arthrobacter sp. NicSoilB8]|nr:hypothetical protein NicSoilB8_45230 [Arthrobacter sp. NicSoilB8]BCW73579.1 hypothetical protein NicSoilB8_46230 [Arthrobacter sp. NicSoilB8]
MVFRYDRGVVTFAAWVSCCSRWRRDTYRIWTRVSAAREAGIGDCLRLRSATFVRAVWFAQGRDSLARAQNVSPGA